MLDILSYLRRRSVPASRKPVAEHEAIDLLSIGGAISTVYLDIASVPARAEKRRGKAPPAAPPPHSSCRPPQPPAPPPVAPAFVPPPIQPDMAPPTAPAQAPPPRKRDRRDGRRQRR